MKHLIRKKFIEEGYILALIPQVLCWTFALTVCNDLIKMSESRPYFLAGVATISIGFTFIIIFNIWYANRKQRTKNDI